MKITKISYQKVFPLGMYINERLGLEAELDETDPPEKSMQELKRMVESMATNPNYGIVHELQPLPDIPIVKDSKQSATDRMLQAINTCTEVKVLETFKFLVKNNPVFQEAYDKKLQSLQKQTNHV